MASANQQITVGSREEHDALVEEYVGKHYKVALTTHVETQLVRDRLVLSEDVGPLIILTLCFVVPGFVYYAYLLMRPLPRVVITIRA